MKYESVIAGIDIGAATAKAVFLKGTEMLASCVIPTGESVKKAAETVMQQMLDDLNRSIEEIEYIIEAIILGIYIELIRLIFFKFLVKDYYEVKGYTLGLGFMSPYFLLLAGSGIFGITLILNPTGVGFSRYVWAHFILLPLGFLEQLVLQIYLSMLILKALKDSKYQN